MKKTLLLTLLTALLIGCGDKPAEQKQSAAPAQAPSAVSAPVALPATPAPVQTATAVAGVAAAAAAPNGAELYKRCAACHGAGGQTPALGKGGAIAGWDRAKLETVLKAYRAGERNTYGLGNMMKGQTEKLSDAEIAALSAHLSAL